jgi:hypothetical protein
MQFFPVFAMFTSPFLISINAPELILKIIRIRILQYTLDITEFFRFPKFYLKIFKGKFAVGHKFIIHFCNLFKCLEYLRYKMMMAFFINVPT